MINWVQNFLRVLGFMIPHKSFNIRKKKIIDNTDYKPLISCYYSIDKDYKKFSIRN